MEARLTKQLLMIIEADRDGYLTPAIQHEISNALDHLHKQIMAPGGAVRSPTGPGLLGGVSSAGLGQYINAGPKVRVPKPSFPKLPSAPKISMPKPPAVPGVK